MLAAYAARLEPGDPLANLEVGDLPDPQVGAGMALLRVQRAALNHHDLWTLRGVAPSRIVPPQILGCDAAGVVEAYGPGVEGDGWPALGERVLIHPVVTCGHCPSCLSDMPSACRNVRLLSEPPLPGTLADRVAVPVQNLIALPESVDVVAAACLPTAYLTAYHMLFSRAALQPGQSVLVHGASGGVASAAITLARLFGITVYATARSDTKRQLALDLGAEAAFPSDAEAHRAVLGATDGVGVDAVIETVGEPTWDVSLKAVRPGGTIVVSGATGGPNPPAQLNRIFFRRITVAGASMGSRGELRRLVELCATGALRPLVGSTYALRDAAAALAEMARGEQRGKIVIDAS